MKGLIIISIIVILLAYYIIEFKRFFKLYTLTYSFIFFNEWGLPTPHFFMELEEQNHAFKYIEPKDTVLELDARYGTVSAVVNRLLENKTNHVVVITARETNILTSRTKKM
jgi:hypothetical protein